MTVLAKSKTSAARFRRHREERPGRSVTGQTETGTVPEPAGPTADRVSRRREAGPPQDTAMYTCHCGFVFKAAVSTSVDCPHCGDTQAW
jgi:hypothetical protein